MTPTKPIISRDSNDCCMGNAIYVNIPNEIDTSYNGIYTKKGDYYENSSGLIFKKVQTYWGLASALFGF